MTGETKLEAKIFKLMLMDAIMKRLLLAAAASVALIGAVQAQCPQGYCPPPPYPPPVAYPPPPAGPLAALFGALFSLFDGGVPSPYLVPDGMGGWVPFTNSRVIAGTMCCG